MGLSQQEFVHNKRIVGTFGGFHVDDIAWHKNPSIYGYEALFDMERL